MSEADPAADTFRLGNGSSPRPAESFNRPGESFNRPGKSFNPQQLRTLCMCSPRHWAQPPRTRPQLR